MLARRCVQQLRRGAHVLVGDPGRPTQPIFLEELQRLGWPAGFIHLKDAPPFGSTTAAAAGGASLTLLLIDEHCTPPFFGGGSS